MADLGEPLELCTCFQEKDLLYVDSDGLAGHVIITCKTNSVFVFKLDDQKAVHSWSVRRGLHITSPARWTSGNSYISVINEQNIHTWSKDDLSFEKSTKKHLKFPLHEILTTEGWDPVAVCKDGTVDFVETIKSSHKGTNSDADLNTIFSCGITSTNNAVCVTCLSQQKNSELTVTHHWYKRDTKEWKVLVTTETCPDKVQCTSSQCRTAGSSVRLYCLLSNGSMVLLDLTHQQADPVRRTVQTIPGVGSSATFTVLDTHHVAVAGTTQDKQKGIGVFDLQFGTLKAWRPYPGVVQPNVKIYSHHGNLLVACGNTMYMIPYTCQKSTVSSILGQQQQLTTAEARPTLPKCVGWPTVAGTSQMEAQMGNQQKTEELAARLCDQEKTRTYQKFQGAFWGLMKCIKEFKSVWYMSSMFTDILTRCLTETRFWPVKEITELMQLYNMPASVMPKLVDALIQHGEISLLHNFLQKVTDVPEVCLCKALQYYITAEDEELAKAAETIFIESLLPDTSSDEKQPFGVHKAYFVNSMLKEGFNDVFLVDYLKSLNFKNVLVLLEHLRHMLGNRLEDIEIEEEDMDEEILFLKKDGEKKRRGLLFGQPTIGQIADWISVTLDAHITQLIISPDARLTLINLHTCVASQVQFYDELSGLEALLDQLKAKCSVTSKQAVGQYCVEVLHIR
ncbi:nucleolar protein 11-like [Mizuhopecten yessoensis]|uniref:Nucleolar protein 11-like n=1 Tax=Mizuhopecten yessoensis TaxID=6573 RepID=A0A210PMS4_MIZYE|nr:nucleolar protein 11-like [Mizuhopecten yessoensis]XP_021379536.1 nucleolar protein 11-like [Mizuhopecten yessoensis]OWF37805.1 Nucleolar protein 11-like [Mizuhopecten yessoensis]